MRPGTHIGPHQIIARLGEGGSSTVHLARSGEDGGWVAIKVLRRELLSHSPMVARFFREAQLLAEIRHDNVVEVREYGRTSCGRPFMVMEYLEGTDLRTELERRGRLPWTETVDIARQLLHALRAIHGAGVVHRDVKPQNCMVMARPGGGWRVKLVDFGVAKTFEAYDRSVTKPQVIVGTPCYMAPEQARAQDVDPRTDVYAMGITMFELLTGHPPFTAPTPTEIISRHLHAHPPSVFDRAPVPGAPIELDSFLRRALAKEPSHRFFGAQDMLDHLERLAAGRFMTTTQVTGRSTTQRRLASGRRRNLGRAALMAAAVIAVIASVALSRDGHDAVAAPAQPAAGAVQLIPVPVFVPVEKPAEGAAGRSTAPDQARDPHAPGQ